VVESLRFRAKDLSPIGGHDTLRIRERIVPLLRLSDVLGVESDADRSAGYAVVLGRGEKRLAVAVDRLLGQQEIVIKALDPSVSGPSVGIAGATIMGDGRVVLILDVAALFERRARGANTASPETGH
jgi:two-component system chemotaxis sensor kinase CheA